jgi:hypothetical protein
VHRPLIRLDAGGAADLRAKFDGAAAHERFVVALSPT